MDQDLINQLIENPDLLKDLANNETLKPHLEEYGNDALKNSRDKVMQQNANYRKQNEQLQEQITEATQPEPAKAAPKSAPKSDEGNEALLARIAQLEEKDRRNAEAQLNSLKREQRDAALAGLHFKDGGMSMAQQLIDLSIFEQQSDGSIRHRDSMMSISDYISQEWSKSEQSKFFLDPSASGGGGATGSKRPGGGGLAKKFSDATPNEKQQYYLDNGEQAYESWKTQG